jgi:hypothetical protein
VFFLFSAPPWINYVCEKHEGPGRHVIADKAAIYRNIVLDFKFFPSLTTGE